MDLNRQERWMIFRKKHLDNGWEIPWDRMAFPPHEWFDSYVKVYNTDIDIYIPKTTSECDKSELELLLEFYKINKNY